MVFLTTSVEESKYGQPKKETVIKIFYRLYTFCLPAGEREREREREGEREREREREGRREGELWDLRWWSHQVGDGLRHIEWECEVEEVLSLGQPHPPSRYLSPLQTSPVALTLSLTFPMFLYFYLLLHAKIFGIVLLVLPAKVWFRGTLFKIHR
jgi:hypothetical protein